MSLFVYIPSRSLRRCHSLRAVNRIKARYVLLPEMPTDTSENNALLRAVEKNELVPLGKLKYKECLNAAAKLGLEYEGWLREYIEEQLDDKKTDSDLIDPLNINLVDAEVGCGTIRQMCAAINYGHDVAVSHLSGIERLFARLYYINYSYPEYYEKLKEISKTPLDPWHARLVNCQLIECKLNGVDLNSTDKHKLTEAHKLTVTKATEFIQNVANSDIKPTERVIEDQSGLAGAPEHVLRILANKPNGPISFPFSVKASLQTYWLFLQYCSKRPARWGIWHSLYARASFREQNVIFNNSSVVEAHREVQEKHAKLFGYPTYGAMQLEYTMAKSVDAVSHFLTSFGEKASDRLDDNYEAMCDFVEAEGLTKEKPDIYDMNYYARKVADTTYNMNHLKFAEYLPYPQTIKNILAYFSRLFDLEITNVSNSVPRWHQTVEAYEIRDRVNGQRSTLYIDPYMRRNKTIYPITVIGRPRSVAAQSDPVVYLNFNLPSPVDNEKPAVIYMDQLGSLGFELGKALEVLLSEAPHALMMGDRLVEWDCKNVCGFVIQRLICRPETIVQLSSHVDDGHKIDLQIAQNHVKGRNDINLPGLVREVVESELDIAMQNTRKFWRDSYRELHTKYLPYKWENKKGDEFICSFEDMTFGPMVGRRYSNLWSKYIASDIVEAFDEKGATAEESVGKRFSDLYLRKGGSCVPSEAFRKFRGRDPSLEPMLKFYLNH